MPQSGVRTRNPSPASPGRVGITATVPIEVILAAGRRPVDLNNLFITHPQPGGLVERAEQTGFPRNMCAWVKGIYTVVQTEGIHTVVATTEGDCSNTRSLIEMLQMGGTGVIPFGYPYGGDEGLLDDQLQRFCRVFGATMDEAEAKRRELETVRDRAREIDRLTCETGQVTGEENHLWLIRCSDMFGDPADYARRADKFLKEARLRECVDRFPRIGFVGIPPICSGLFEFMEEQGAQVVFNEMQRQFSMPYRCKSLLEQYRRYTYPYDIFFRLEDIRQEVRRRRIDALVHYVQSFCFRYVQDCIIRERVGVPVLTLECDRPGPIDSRAMTRIEAFLEMLRGVSGAAAEGVKGRHAV
ncbi:MAG: 2-hydroxyacyl-CoA dehydratase [Planctomycetes bacterium]|nr:2-hydroxyacyl-CoA dehydratase [Planctomycetota bacterium]